MNKWYGTCWTCKNINSKGIISLGGITPTCPHSRYAYRVCNIHNNYKKCTHYKSKL